MTTNDGEGRPETPASVVKLTINEPALAAPVLERLVSAAAAQAQMPVDRVVNALTAVDGLVAAADKVLASDHPRKLSVTIGDAALSIAIDSLQDGQAEALRQAAVLPDVGDVFQRTASSVEIKADGSTSELVIQVN